MIELVFIPLLMIVHKAEIPMRLPDRNDQDGFILWVSAQCPVSRLLWSSKFCYQFVNSIFGVSFNPSIPKILITDIFLVLERQTYHSLGIGILFGRARANEY